jgi:signal transduction histidine kinase
MQSQVNDLVSAFVERRLRGKEDDQVELIALGSEELTGFRAQLERTAVDRDATLCHILSELEAVSGAIAEDMRAPLRTVQSLALLYGRDGPGISAEQRTGYAGQITAACSRLDKLLQNTLAYNSAIARVLPLQSVQLSSLIKGLITRYPEFNPCKADIQIEGNLPAVLGNETLLTQCFSNLLENAVKFVAAGVFPQVRIYAEPGSDVARIWIKDNGIGIPRHAQPRLFGLFQKVNADRDGSGIGLAIVHRLVERLDGKVGVESEPGRGSRFWVEFKTAVRC